MKQSSKDINSKFDSLKAPIDKEQLWASIRNDDAFPIAKKSKKRRYLIFLLLGLVLAGSLIVNEFKSSNKPVDHAMSIPSESSIPTEAVIATTAKGDIIITADSCLGISSSNTKDLQKTLSLKKPSTTQTFDRRRSGIRKNIPVQLNEKPNFDSPSNSIKTVPQKDILRQVVEDFPLAFISNISVNKISKLSFDGLNIPLLLHDLSHDIVNTEIPSKWNISLAIGSGYGFHRLLEVDSISGVSVDFRDQNTTSVESYLVEVQVSRRLKKDWFLAFGAQYSTNYQHFEYQESNTKHIRNPSTDPYFYSKVEETVEYSYYHKYSFLDMKLSLGKVLPINKFTISGSLGIGITANFDMSGKVIDTLNNNVDVLLNKDMEYKTALNPFFFAKARLTRAITPRIGLFFGLEAKSPMKLSTSTASFNHRIIPVFGKIGTTIKF